MTIHSSILAWKIPWTEEAGRLQSTGLKSQTQLQRLTTIISHVCLPPQGATTTTTKLLQSCPTLCDPMDCSPPGSPVPGILQARTLKWVAIGEASIKIPVGPGSGSSEVSIDMLG